MKFHGEHTNLHSSSIYSSFFIHLNNGQFARHGTRAFQPARMHDFLFQTHCLPAPTICELLLQFVRRLDSSSTCPAFHYIHYPLCHHQMSTRIKHPPLAHDTARRKTWGPHRNRRTATLVHARHIQAERAALRRPGRRPPTTVLPPICYHQMSTSAPEQDKLVVKLVNLNE